MGLEAPPYGKAEIGRVRPGPDQADAEVLDLRREGQLAGRQPASYYGVPPVKKPPWEWYYIPVYFWVGGIGSGAWLAAAAEDVAGGRDRAVIRTGRYVSLGAVLGGTALLIADLGRPERFLYMLRIVRARSPMSLGSWGLVAFGAAAGGAAVLQAAEDGRLGRWPRLAGLSRGRAGQALHLAGLPLALFVGGYTGVLLAATAIPAWARRRLTLPPLFTVSGASTGIAAVSAAVELAARPSAAVRRRLATAKAVALASELALDAADRLAARALPSVRRKPAPARAAHWLTVGLGMAAPLALDLLSIARGGRRRRRTTATRSLVAAGLTLAGGLALRLLASAEGKKSGDLPADTWRFAGRPPDHTAAPEGYAVPARPRGGGARPEGETAGAPA